MVIENVTEINEVIKRGDGVSFDIIVEGDHTEREVYFTAKINRNLTTERTISLDNQTVGGLSLVYNDPNTTITVTLEPEETADIQVASLVCDIESVSALDATDVVTAADGTLGISYDVRTPFDGYDLPVDPVTFQQIDASDFEVNSMMWVQEVDGLRTMVELTLAELKAELDSL